MRPISWALAVCGLCFTHTLSAQTPVQVAPAPVVPLVSEPTPTLAPLAMENTEAPNPYAGDLLTRDYLTGDWSGWRSKLADRGVTMDLFATQYYQGVTRGGQSRDFEYGGKLDYLLNVDGHKLGLWKGLFVNMHAETRFGTDTNGIDGLLVPSTLPMSFPEANKSITAITGLKVTQALSENFVVYAGKINTLQEFPLRFSPGNTSNLPGLAGFSSGALVFNPIVARTVPYSAAGVGAAYVVDELPVFSLSVFDPEERAAKGLENLYARGVTIVPDLILSGKLFGRPATLNLGGTYSNSKYRALDPSAYLNLLRIGQLREAIGAEELPEETGSWSLYANGYQALWVNPCNEKVSWGLFGAVGLSDGNPNPIRYYAAGGIGGRSMIRGRESDSFGVGYYYVGLSDQFKNLTRAIKSQRDEYGVELFYNYAVTPWCRLTPNFQVARPSTVGVDTTLLAGLRLQLIF
jgi:porin